MKMSSDLLDAISALEKDKGISKEVLIDALEAALVSAYKRNFNQAQNVRVDINEGLGQIKVFARKDVVDEVEDPRLQLSLDEAQKINPNYVTDDVVEIEVTPKNFGRIAAQTAKQVVTQRVREAERGVIYSEFIDREDDIMTGIVQRIDHRFIYVYLAELKRYYQQVNRCQTSNIIHMTESKSLLLKLKTQQKALQLWFPERI